MLHRVQKRGGVPPSSFGGRAVVAAALALAAVLIVPAISLHGAARAQSPTPTPIVAPADPRTDPEPAGMTGAPVLAAVAVVAMGALAVLATFIYVRLVARR